MTTTGGATAASMPSTTWLGGSDVQWLYGVDEDHAHYGHDHGFYLTGPDWTEASLTAARERPFVLSFAPAQLGRGEVARLADALDQLTRDAIDAELSSSRSIGR